MAKLRIVLEVDVIPLSKDEVIRENSYMGEDILTGTEADIDSTYPGEWASVIAGIIDFSDPEMFGGTELFGRFQNTRILEADYA